MACVMIRAWMGQLTHFSVADPSHYYHDHQIENMFGVTYSCIFHNIFYHNLNKIAACFLFFKFKSCLLYCALCAFNNSSLAWRKICDPSLDINLSDKTKWQKGVTQCAVSCHFGILTKICFIYKSHVSLMFRTDQVSHNFSKHDIYKWNRFSIAYQMKIYGNLSHTILPFCFSTQIVIRWPFQILRDASNAWLNTTKNSIDSQCNNGY